MLDVGTLDVPGAFVPSPSSNTFPPTNFPPLYLCRNKYFIVSNMVGFAEVIAEANHRLPVLRNQQQAQMSKQTRTDYAQHVLEKMFRDDKKNKGKSRSPDWFFRGFFAFLHEWMCD
jgi:hypothetical protein